MPYYTKSTAKAPKKYVMFQRDLLAWYVQYGRRDLPWRNTADPYAIYVSEVMLQQTQVETVRSRYYQPFLARFPTFSALAKASEKDVLTLWQGLGYYSRARNLHKAAKLAGGKMPADVEGLMSLPGIGRNTAHAVAAFAYHLPVAVMEANVKRVLTRIFAWKNPTTEQLWEAAEALLNRDNPFDHNQAMMDIGAMVCTRRNPRCGECPASSICAGKSAPEKYPAAKKKKAVPVREKHITVYVNEKGELHTTPRKTAFLNGLYHFSESDAPPEAATLIGGIEQSYSHFTLSAHVYVATRAGKKDFHTWEAALALPMSMAEKKILQLLFEHNQRCC